MMVNEKDIAIISKIGGREQNQDFALAFKSKQGTLLVLCDGAGGYNGGGYASKFVANFIINNFRSFSGDVEIKEFLINSIIESNKQLIEQSDENPDLSGMKTTLAMVYINGAVGISFHLGDSRIYQYRNGSLIFRSKDHSLVQELLNNKKISKKEAINHPKSNVITRVLGAKLKLEIEINDLKIKGNDIFLLTSDGIHGLLADKQILSYINTYNSLGEICQKLCDASEVEGIKSKSSKHDNITALLYSREFKKIWFIRKWKNLLIGFLVLGLLLLYYSYFIKESDSTIDQKQESKLEKIWYYNYCLNSSAMDSITKLDTINTIHLHKDSFEMPDYSLIKKYNIKIDSTQINDTIIFKKQKYKKNEISQNH